MVDTRERRRLEDKVAIVTGAGSGIGEAIALRFASEGASVCAVSLSGSAERVTSQIIERGGLARFCPCDIGDSAQVREMVRTTLREFGAVDILVNNAARNRGEAPVSESVADMTEEHWLATIETNLSGYFLCSKYVLPHMITKGGGTILNMASAAGVVGIPNLSAYAVSKAGVIALTKCMAIDYGAAGVRINALLPAIDTRRMQKVVERLGPSADPSRTTPLRRPGSVEEAASVALFLCSDESSYVSGAIVPVDGGSAAKR